MLARSQSETQIRVKAGGEVRKHPSRVRLEVSRLEDVYVRFVFFSKKKEHTFARVCAKERAREREERGAK